MGTLLPCRRGEKEAEAWESLNYIWACHSSLALNSVAFELSSNCCPHNEKCVMIFCHKAAIFSWCVIILGSLCFLQASSLPVPLSVSGLQSLNRGLLFCFRAVTACTITSESIHWVSIACLAVLNSKLVSFCLAVPVGLGAFNLFPQYRLSLF